MLMSQAADMTRELRAQGATPEGAVKSIKHALGSTAVTPPDKMKEAVVTCCIVTFFEE